MKRYIIQVGTVTYAIKARDILRRKGFKVEIERKTSENSRGCGYVVVLQGNAANALEILRENGVKTLGLTEEN